MARTLDVDIDEAGVIRSVNPAEKLPSGRAKLTWTETADYELLLMSEPALSDWLRPEEDEGVGSLTAAEIVLLQFPFSDLSGAKSGLQCSLQTQDAAIGSSARSRAMRLATSNPSSLLKTL